MSETNTNQNRVKAKAKFLVRRRKAKNWSGITLESGELGLVIDSTDNSKKVKIGDGVTVWEELPWLTVGELKFDPESPNAQSGLAVAQAVEQHNANENSHSDIRNEIATIKSSLSAGTSRVVVDKLPPLKDAEENKKYMVRKNNPETGNWYDEYMFIPILQGEHSGITVTNASWEETETPFILKRATCLRWEQNDDNTVYNYVFKGWDNSGVETTISFTLPIDTGINRDFSVYIDFSSLYADFTILSKTEISAKVYHLYDFSNPYELIGNTSVNLSEVLYGYATTGYVDEAVGDIESALDELHAYAQSLISGGATE